MRFVVLPVLLLFACSAIAAPQDDKADEIGHLMVKQGLIAQLDQVRQTVTDRTTSLVGSAMGFLGVPYRFGGTSAETGFDCSGFVRAMYNQTLGHVLPRRAEEQAAATEKIDRNELKPGDLVFFNTMRRAFSHVGIYIGDGKFIHAPRTGKTVQIEDMNGKYWLNRFNGARRVPGVEATSGGE
ncbi:C40 family peptidase [Variovorax sp. J22R133]|uniref:C40 family peptidase n=1 Tax=Variovorax brevis TaxID=3053503 RepID=UPI0025782B98|nr:C40 family peptidase [Variovorax sp. J22R133]MDM0112152.1 C40 family peptidase [Variovorax sp. J22R133]